jgi:hypothetical protein
VDQPHYGASSLIEWRFNCLKTMMGLKKSSIYLRALGCLSKRKTRLEELSKNPQVLINASEKWISAFAEGSPPIQTRNDQPRTGQRLFCDRLFPG